MAVTLVRSEPQHLAESGRRLATMLFNGDAISGDVKPLTSIDRPVRTV